MRPLRLLCAARTRPAWRQLLAAWVVFVITAGVYQVPPALFGGRCAGASAPCSLAEEFSLSAADVGWLPAVFLVCKGVLALPAGAAMHRYGPQRCIAAGSVLLAVVTSLYGFASGYAQLLVLHMLFGAAYCLCGLTPLVCHTNSWFDDDAKATSIGLLVTAFSTAGVVWPPLTAAVASKHGWRAAAAVLPAAAWLVAVPIATLVLRDGPVAQRRGGAVELTSAQIDASSAEQSPAAKLGEAPTRAARWRRLPWWMREPTVAHLASMSACTLYIVNSLLHLLQAANPAAA